jgi:hypothetical protein
VALLKIEGEIKGKEEVIDGLKQRVLSVKE